MREFKYKSRGGDVEVLIGVDHGQGVGNLLNKYTGCLGVASISLKGIVKIPCDSIFIRDGEEGKDISTVLEIAKVAHEKGLDRDSVIIGVGGGSVLDVVGFAASIYMRGIDYVNVPTTTLSMVDAALGGKTAVNAMGIKNLLGIIRQPKYIIVDLKFLKTLPEGNYIDGFAEVVKYGITMDVELFNYVKSNYVRLLHRDEDSLEEVIYRSLRLKAKVVEEDEEDRLGVRIVLNYGHTVGHALESATGFGLSHGRAVALGMLCEAKVGNKLGYTSENVVDELLTMVSRLGLVDKPMKIDTQVLVKAITADKKKSGDFIKLPMVTRVGEWIPIKVQLSEYSRLVIEVCGFMH